MTAAEQALTLLRSAKEYKARARSSQRSARALMESFHRVCRREGIDPDELKRMQGDGVDGGHHGRKQE